MRIIRCTLPSEKSSPAPAMWNVSSTLEMDISIDGFQVKSSYTHVLRFICCITHNAYASIFIFWKPGGLKEQQTVSDSSPLQGAAVHRKSVGDEQHSQPAGSETKRPSPRRQWVAKFFGTQTS